MDKQTPKNSSSKTHDKGLADRAGDMLEKAGDKISDMGAEKIGQKIHDLGDKMEKSHANPNHRKGQEL